MTEAVGTLAEEAAKLFGAAESWWREHAPAAPDHVGPECRVCPFCQVLSVVRTAQPELFEQVSSAVVSLTAALRSAVSHPPRPDVQVEHIDVL